MYFVGQVGLKGEDLGLSNGGSTLWKSQTALPTNQPLIWYKVIFVSDMCNLRINVNILTFALLICSSLS